MKSNVWKKVSHGNQCLDFIHRHYYSHRERLREKVSKAVEGIKRSDNEHAQVTTARERGIYAVSSWKQNPLLSPLIPNDWVISASFRRSSPCLCTVCHPKTDYSITIPAQWLSSSYYSSILPFKWAARVQHPLPHPSRQIFYTPERQWSWRQCS